jgi:hypothetical protein
MSGGSGTHPSSGSSRTSDANTSLPAARTLLSESLLLPEIVQYRYRIHSPESSYNTYYMVNYFRMNRMKFDRLLIQLMVFKFEQLTEERTCDIICSLGGDIEFFKVAIMELPLITKWIVLKCTTGVN